MSEQRSKLDQYNDLMSTMAKTKGQLDEEQADDNDDNDGQQDRLLSEAIDLAIEQGRGWAQGEKEAFLERILDDDFIPPLFASSAEEVEKSGVQEAFTSLIYEGESPTRLMIQFRQKGHDALTNGKRNVAGNAQYYRDAINHYHEALEWALKIEPLQAGDLAQADTDDPTYTEPELNELRSSLCSNIALMHWQLKNWGYTRDESTRALEYNPCNIKAWFRLAKAHEQLKHWDEAGDALDQGLAVDKDNVELNKLSQKLATHIRKARQARQQRAKARAERISKVKQVWKHCQQNKQQRIQLGRTALVTTASEGGIDVDDDENAEQEESKWHQHLPMSGILPRPVILGGGGGGGGNDEEEWVWPCMFLYPSHLQSDFIKEFGETEMLAARMAQMFPELEEETEEENGSSSPSTTATTSVPWDVNNEFVCSNLAVYFEVHNNNNNNNNINDNNNNNDKTLIHPEGVQILLDQASCMRFYESSRALKGDEGPEMAQVVRAMERKHLYVQRKQWKKVYKTLWANKPDHNPVVRVHPGVLLQDVLRDARCIVPNFIVTFFIFPESHPAHDAFLKEHTCLDILQPRSQ